MTTFPNKDPRRKTRLRETSRSCSHHPKMRQHPPPSLSSPFHFEVGSRVHPGSWGTRVSVATCTTNRSSNNNKFSSQQHNNQRSPQQPWTASDFCVGKLLGAGYFGKIHHAVYMPRNGSVGSSTVNNGAADEPLRLSRNNEVAIKCFAKSKLLWNTNDHRRGTSSSEGYGRALQLLRREVNIQSQ